MYDARLCILRDPNASFEQSSFERFKELFLFMLFVPAKQVIVLFFVDIYEFCNTKFLEDVYTRAFDVCRALSASKSCGASGALDSSVCTFIASLGLRLAVSTTAREQR